MKQQIENAILKAIGEDKEILKTPFFKTPNQDKIDESYNEALADLRSRAPQLAEEIVGIVRDKLDTIDWTEDKSAGYTGAEVWEVLGLNSLKS